MSIIGLPRMRGDPPFLISPIFRRKVSTPHARGSTLTSYDYGWSIIVYPACAGIHLKVYREISLRECLPRMRGDPPHTIPRGPVPGASTPHARGSTLARAGKDQLR